MLKRVSRLLVSMYLRKFIEMISQMNSNNSNNRQLYNNCAGKNCNRKGINKLRIRYIKKLGYFCDSCTLRLLEMEIVTKEEKQFE
jgi:uncharacterized protein YqkB